MEGNPIECDMNVESLLNHLKEEQKEITVYSEIKLMVVGDGGIEISKNFSKFIILFWILI